METATTTTALTAKQYQDYFTQGITYDEYLKNFQGEIDLGDESPFAQYLPQNWKRQSRLDRKLKLRDDLRAAIAAVQEPVKWLLITEHWCGDASQINPIIKHVAEASNGNIELKLVYRDQHEELIDAHLTDGRSRSIPILLQLDSNYNYLSSYGPRPDDAQVLVKSTLAAGESYMVPLHTWYAKDKQQSVQNDLVALLGTL